MASENDSQIMEYKCLFCTSNRHESFQIVTDRDETFGPFAVSDATEVFYFDVDFITQRLRFEVLTTSGGNTGAIEIEVYGEPQG